MNPGLPAQGGLTLIELMVVVGLLSVLLALAAPSMRDMIEVRRLRGINAQLITDLQFARSEAISRRAVVRLEFKESDSKSCYTISTSSNRTVLCDCLATGPACPEGGAATELRTVVYPKSTGSAISFPYAQHRRFAFEPAMGGLVSIPIDFNPQPLPEIWIEPKIDNARKFRIQLLQSGRPSVCAPEGSRMDVPACPPD